MSSRRGGSARALLAAGAEAGQEEARRAARESVYSGRAGTAAERAAALASLPVITEEDPEPAEPKPAVTRKVEEPPAQVPAPIKEPAQVQVAPAAAEDDAGSLVTEVAEPTPALATAPATAPAVSAPAPAARKSPSTRQRSRDADVAFLEGLAEPAHRGTAAQGRSTTYKIPTATLDRLAALTRRARRERRITLLRIRLLENGIQQLAPENPGLAGRPPKTARSILATALPEELHWRVADLAEDGAVRLDMSDVVTVALDDILDKIQRALDRLGADDL